MYIYIFHILKCHSTFHVNSEWQKESNVRESKAKRNLNFSTQNERKRRSNENYENVIKTGEHSHNLIRSRSILWKQIRSIMENRKRMKRETVYYRKQFSPWNQPCELRILYFFKFHFSYLVVTSRIWSDISRKIMTLWSTPWCKSRCIPFRSIRMDWNSERYQWQRKVS